MTSRVYGPVPSRRLGRSLGVDLVPLKVCPYDCVYCQLGPTLQKTTRRRSFFPPQVIIEEVRQKLALREPEVITLAGAGEPTLHAQFGAVIEGIKGLTNLPVALLTNGALFGDPEVRREATLADIVLPSLDAGEEDFFQWVNRPAEKLSLESVTEGLTSFRQVYRGQIWLEVMVLAGFTELPQTLESIAKRARCIQPDKIQLNTPVRPASNDYVLPLSRDRLNCLCDYFRPKAEVIADESSAVDGPPIPVADMNAILELLCRRPCTLEDVCTGLSTSGPSTLKALLALMGEGRVRGQLLQGRYFYMAVQHQASQRKGMSCS